MATFGEIKSDELKDYYYIPPATIFPFAGEVEPAGWVFCDGATYGTADHPNLFDAIGYQYGGSGSDFIVPDLRGRVIAGRDMDNGGGTSGRLDNFTSSGTVSGVAGGSKNHSLSISEIPAHDHGTSTISSGVAQTAGAHTHSSITDATNTDHEHSIANQPNVWASLFRKEDAGEDQGLTKYRQSQRNIVVNTAPAGLTIGGMTSNQVHSHTFTTNSTGSHTHTVSGNVVTNSAGGGNSHNIVQPTMVMNYIIKV